MVIRGYSKLNYHELLMASNGYWFSKLNYHRPLMAIGGYYINDY